MSLSPAELLVYGPLAFYFGGAIGLAIVTALALPRALAEQPVLRAAPPAFSALLITTCLLAWPAVVVAALTDEEDS